MENISHSERKCLCQDGAVGDDYHFLFECYMFPETKDAIS